MVVVVVDVVEVGLSEELFGFFCSFWEKLGSSAMQAVGFGAAISIEKLSWGESVLGGDAEIRSPGDCNDSLVKLRCGRNARVVACATSYSVPPAALTEASVLTRERYGFRAQSSVTTEPSERSFMSAEQKVFEVVQKQAAMVNEERRRSVMSLQDVRSHFMAGSAVNVLDEAYVRCGEVCAEYSKTFYLGKTTFLSLDVLHSCFRPRHFQDYHRQFTFFTWFSSKSATRILQLSCGIVRY